MTEKNKLKITVLYPIVVPNGKYCWDGITPCDHFDNEGGCSNCNLGFYPLENSSEGFVLKPDQCLELKEKELK